MAGLARARYPPLVPMNFHRLLLVTIMGAAGSGCAADNELFQRDLDDVGRQVSQLRAENAAMRERLEALEADETVRLERELPPTEERPDLAVVTLGPEEEAPPQAVTAPPPEEPAKTVIVGRGDRVEERGAKR